jgi:hypothetical protein
MKQALERQQACAQHAGAHDCSVNILVHVLAQRSACVLHTPCGRSTCGSMVCW